MMMGERLKCVVNEVSRAGDVCLTEEASERGPLTSPWGTGSAKSSGQEESSASLGDYCVAEVMPS